MPELSRRLPSMRGSIAVCLLLAAQALLLPALAAQCGNPWPTVPGSPGVEGYVFDTLVYDPDGPGPIGERVLVSGTFDLAGTVQVDNLAVYDPAARTWAEFAPGPFPKDLQLARDSTGAFYFAGDFDDIAGVTVSNIARFDGTTWSAVGGGVDERVTSMTITATDDVVVTGPFTTAGGVGTQGIARWNGSLWSSMNSATLSSPVFPSVIELPNGDIAAGVRQGTLGSYTSAVMRFDGATWTQIGATFGTVPTALGLGLGGELLASSSFVAGFAQQFVARWNGISWVPLANAPFIVGEFVQLPNGLLAACAAGSFAGRSVAVWDGFGWTVVGEATTTSWSLSVLANGELLLGGNFNGVTGTPARGLARFNGAAWSAASDGLALPIEWLAVATDGAIYAAADLGAPGASLVHRWTGVGWTPIGGAYPFANGYQAGLAGLFALPDGRLLTGGSSVSSFGTAPVLQQWFSGSWVTLATTTDGSVNAVLGLPTGELIVGGEFTSLNGDAVTNVARFNGQFFSPLGTGLPGKVDDLELLPDGDVLALVFGRVFRWNGDNWQQMGLSVATSGYELLVDPDGVPVLAGEQVLRWDGQAWTPLGTGLAGPVGSAVFLPGGDLVVGPRQHFSVTGARFLERWDGTAWSVLGGEVAGSVESLAVAGNGDLLLGGDFKVANGEVRNRFARVSTTCAAQASYEPAGCSLSASTNLVAEVLPWLGGVSRSRATFTSFPQLGIEVLGIAPLSTPLSQLLPGLQTSGCELVVTPDVLSVLLPTPLGQLVGATAIPNNAALIGLSYRQQLIAFYLDAATGAPLVARSTNALNLQIGSF